MDVLLYIGSAIILVWGITHVVPTKSVVKGFGGISKDNTRIITMEWAAEGVTIPNKGAKSLGYFVLTQSSSP